MKREEKKPKLLIRFGEVDTGVCGYIYTICYRRKPEWFGFENWLITFLQNGLSDLKVKKVAFKKTKTYFAFIVRDSKVRGFDIAGLILTAERKAEEYAADPCREIEKIAVGDSWINYESKRGTIDLMV